MKVGTDAVLLGAWVNAGTSRRVLDVGTGSGVIALMLAQRFPELSVTGIDIHRLSVKQAKNNFERSLWHNRLEAIAAPIQKFKPKVKFDLIVSNPPYFNAGNHSPIRYRAEARHTPTLTHDALLQHSSELLTSSGSLAVILPAQDELMFIHSAKEYGFHPWRKMSFKPKRAMKPERVLFQFHKNHQAECDETEMIHYESDGTWSEQYKALTREFYLKI